MSRPHNAWLTTEIALLRQLWPAQGAQCAPVFPRHSLASVKRRAHTEGLCTNRGAERRKAALAKVRGLMQRYGITAEEVAA